MTIGWTRDPSAKRGERPLQHVKIKKLPLMK